jgi:hypothetical protein
MVLRSHVDARMRPVVEAARLGDLDVSWNRIGAIVRERPFRRHTVPPARGEAPHAPDATVAAAAQGPRNVNGSASTKLSLALPA